jgi:biotin operon repressor
VYACSVSIGGVESAGSPPKGDGAMEKKVLDAMKKAGQPVRPGDLAKELGLDSKEVSKAINTLKKQGKVVSPKRCYYAPSDD